MSLISLNAVISERGYRTFQFTNHIDVLGDNIKLLGFFFFLARKRTEAVIEIQICGKTSLTNRQNKNTRE